MDYEWSSRVLVRGSTSEQFGGPFETQFPSIMYGWRTIPVQKCQRLLSTWTPGGCAQEDIVWLEPKPDY